MVDQATNDDFLLLCSEFGLNDFRRRGLLWHSLCRARAIGGQQVCISLRALIGKPHPTLRRPMTLREVHQAVIFHQHHQAEDMQKWHDLPEVYRTIEHDRGEELAPCGAHNPAEVGSIPTSATKEGAKDGTGEAPAVCQRNEPAAPTGRGSEVGECGGSDDAETCG